MLRYCLMLVTLLSAATQVGCDGGASQATTDRKPTPERPNIIFILTDDQKPDTLGVDGNKLIRTPHLDRMANEGTYFTRAYNIIPQCAPSRAALLTGFYPHVYGPMDNDGDGLDPQVEPLAMTLKNLGYRCGMVGKWHLGDPLTKQAGFDDFWVGYDRTKTPRNKKYTNPTIVVNGEEMKTDRFLTDAFGDYALEFIDQKPDERFFLWLAFHAPHEPVAEHPDFIYNPDDMRMPESIKDNLMTKPSTQRTSAPARAFDRMRPLDLRHHKAKYYSMISAVDANVGRILDHLRKTGRDKNTLVVFMSDNGWAIGEHRLFTKGPAFYEELIRTPMIFWQPETIPGGARHNGLVSSEDIHPTLVRRGGGNYPPRRKGYDLWPQVLGEKESERDAVFVEFIRKSQGSPTPSVAMVTERYKMTLYLNVRQGEFYDMQEDPHEMYNLYKSEEHQELISQFRPRLEAFSRQLPLFP